MLSSLPIRTDRIHSVAKGNPTGETMMPIVSKLALALSLVVFATGATAQENANLAPLRAEVHRQHDANVQRLKDWIALPSIAAENLNYPQGAEHMQKLLQEAGFQHTEVIPTAGKPGVFATLD